MRVHTAPGIGWPLSLITLPLIVCVWGRGRAGNMGAVVSTPKMPKTTARVGLAFSAIFLWMRVQVGTITKFYFHLPQEASYKFKLARYRASVGRTSFVNPRLFTARWRHRDFLDQWPTPRVIVLVEERPGLAGGQSESAADNPPRGRSGGIGNVRFYLTVNPECYIQILFY